MEKQNTLIPSKSDSGHLLKLKQIATESLFVFLIYNIFFFSAFLLFIIRTVHQGLIDLTYYLKWIKLKVQTTKTEEKNKQKAKKQNKHYALFSKC